MPPMPRVAIDQSQARELDRDRDRYLAIGPIAIGKERQDMFLNDVGLLARHGIYLSTSKSPRVPTRVCTRTRASNDTINDAIDRSIEPEMNEVNYRVISVTVPNLSSLLSIVCLFAC